MAIRFSTMAAALALLAAMPLAAQIALPGGVLPGLPGAEGLLDAPLGTAGRLLTGTTAEVSAALRQARLARAVLTAGGVLALAMLIALVESCCGHLRKAAVPRLMLAAAAVAGLALVLEYSWGA